MEIPFTDAEGSYSFIYSVLYVSRKKNLENNIQTNKQNQNQPLLSPITIHDRWYGWLGLGVSSQGCPRSPL